MDTANAKILRFGDVATAIGTTPKALRHWIQREQVQLETERGEGWQEFSFVDLAALTIVKSLADYGVDVSEAYECAQKAIDWKLSHLQFSTRMPARAVLAAFKESAFFYSKNSEPKFFDNREARVRLLPTVFVTIDTHVLLPKVFRSAGECIEDAALVAYCDKHFS